MAAMASIDAIEWTAIATSGRCSAFGTDPGEPEGGLPGAEAQGLAGAPAPMDASAASAGAHQPG